MRVTRGGPLWSVAVLVVVAAGCGTAVPSPSPTLQATRIPATPSPAATASAVTRPTPDTTPRLTPSPGLIDLDVEAQRVPTQFAGRVATFVSLGDQIAWSGGQGEDDNDLYRYIQGASEPELLYANPDRNSVLTSIAGGNAGYVFTEERWIDGDPHGWRLLYLPAPGTEPLILDESTDDRLIAPTVAMNDTWIAWEAVHGTPTDRSNELRVARVADPLHPQTLLDYAGRDVYLEFPRLWGDELWYGIVANNWVAGTEAPRVEMIDLSRPDDPPATFGVDQRAFMPAPGKDIVAWKSGGDATLSALNSGALTIYTRASGQIEVLPIPGEERIAERISYPSVGNRYVAWWDDIRQRLYVYDYVERQFRRIAEREPTAQEFFGKPSISGDLLVYLHILSESERYLEWTTLPS